MENIYALRLFVCLPICLITCQPVFACQRPVGMPLKLFFFLLLIELCRYWMRAFGFYRTFAQWTLYAYKALAKEREQQRLHCSYFLSSSFHCRFSYFCANDQPIWKCYKVQPITNEYRFWRVCSSVVAIFSFFFFIWNNNGFDHSWKHSNQQNENWKKSNHNASRFPVSDRLVGEMAFKNENSGADTNNNNSDINNKTVFGIWFSLYMRIYTTFWSQSEYWIQ